MLRKPGKELPAFYGGIIMALMTNIPFLNLITYGCCCGGVLLCGFFAVMFYKNDFTPETPPFTAGDCMTVGGLAGLVGAVIGSFLWLILMALFGNVMGEFLLNWIKQNNIDALSGFNLHDLESSLHEGVTALGFFFELLKNFIIDIVFGALGGLIAYNIFKPRYQIMPPSSYNQGPPPPSI